MSWGMRAALPLEDRGCPLVAFADNSTSTRAVLSRERNRAVRRAGLLRVEWNIRGDKHSQREGKRKG